MGGAQKIARNHHYVPQCYLCGFAKHSRKPKLFVVDTKERRMFHASTRNVGAERDFNRIDIKGQAPDALEKLYANFEGQFAPSLQRTIAAKAFVSEDDRIIILNLVALLALRNPRFRGNMRDFRERCYKLKMDLLTATPERWNAHLKQMKMAGKGDDLPEIEYSDLKAFVRREDWRLSVSTTQHVHEELQLIEKIVPIFFWRNWIILKSAPGKETFVTADHPVTLLWSDPKMQGFPAGFGMEGTEVLFPLSKDLALVGVFNSSATELQVNNRIVAAFNGSTILNAERQIYAQDGEFSYLLRGNGTLKRGRELLNDRIFLARNHTS